ncbi:hypothetical protein GF323_04780 [Candidatus Woesearchaeota archaeon]|nr:hypothetical protein [Candidatus Woesearchaeota archaeon]
MSLKDFLLQFKQGFDSGIKQAEARFELFTRKLEYKLESFKKRIFLSVLQGFFVLLGLFFLIAGAMLFFSRYFSLDIILLISGLIILYIAFLAGWKR